MAYQTSAPASTSALISDLITFAVASGGVSLGNTWTFTASSVNYTARALLRDSQYINIAWKTTSPDRVYLNTSTNNPTTGALTAQTACSTVNKEIVLGTSPVRYHMFADGYSTHCAVEWLGGAYQHINLGHLEKIGTYTGGAYVDGSWWNPSYYAQDGDSGSYHNRPFDLISVASTYGRCGHVRATYGGNTIHSLGLNAGNPGGAACNVNSWAGSSIYLDRTPIGRSPNSYNGRAGLIPVLIALGETDSGTPASVIPIGQVRNAAHINIANLNPGDMVLTDWMVFPWSAKNAGGVTYVNSLNYGIAYKK